jgi:hypothetical protein
VNASGVPRDTTVQLLTTRLFYVLPATTALVAPNTQSRVTILTTRPEEALETMPSLALLEHGLKP